MLFNFKYWYKLLIFLFVKISFLENFKKVYINNLLIITFVAFMTSKY